MPADSQIGPVNNLLTARQQYAAYLTTDELVRALEAAESKLAGKLLTGDPTTRAVWREVQRDLANELAGRQLSLWSQGSPLGRQGRVRR